MKRLILFILIIYPIVELTSFELGAALSIDYFNNPIEDSAPSPVQASPKLFHNLNLGFFNLRSGFSVTTAIYEISPELQIPVFNDYYAGFYTIEFDVSVYPGILIPIGNVSLGIAGGAGARLPVITEVDSGVEREDADSALQWFYEDMRYLFWGGDILAIFKLPVGEDTKLFTSVNYKNFLYRDDNWTIGATVGLLWLF